MQEEKLELLLVFIELPPLPPRSFIPLTKDFVEVDSYKPLVSM